jgi:hypothetical protein
MTNKKKQKYSITQKTIPREITVTFKEVTDEKPKSK